MNGCHLFTRSGYQFLAVALMVTTFAGCHKTVSLYSPSGSIPDPVSIKDGLNDQTYVAFDPATGNVLVTNGVDDDVAILTPSGKLSATFPSDGAESPNHPNFPTGIAIEGVSRTVYVSDNGNNQIQVYAPSGSTWALTSTFGGPGGAPGQLKRPYGIAVDPASKSVFVADAGNNRVQVFDAKGGYIGQFGTAGRATGQFSNPEGIAIDPYSQNIIVGDSGNTRVQVFDHNQTFLFQFGSAGTGAGQFAPGSPTGDPADFNSPMGVAVDPVTDNIIVSDGGNSRVEIFDSAGHYLNGFGSRGTGLGQFATPIGVAVDPASCDLAVDDYGNYRVEIFTPQSNSSLPVAVTTAPTRLDWEHGRYTLNASVGTGSCGSNNGAGPTTVSFQYVAYNIEHQPTTITYASTVPAVPASLPAGKSAQSVAAPFQQQCNSMVHYRVVASNSVGTAYGADQSFLTVSCE